MSQPNIVGTDCDEGPPVPIPNTEVKLICAENTWRAAAREDRTVPTQKERHDENRVFSFCIQAEGLVWHQIESLVCSFFGLITYHLRRITYSPHGLIFSCHIPFWLVKTKARLISSCFIC